MMKWQYFVFCAFVSFTFVVCIKVDTCDESGIKDVPGVIHFEAEGCDKFPCPLVRGTKSNVNITFRVPTDTNDNTIKIESKVFGNWIVFPAPDTNACHNMLNTYCPLDENELATYHLAIPIVKAYPKFAMTLRIQFIDERNNIMACFTVPCAVVDKPKS